MKIDHLTLGRRFGRHVGIRCVPPSDGIASAVSGSATIKKTSVPLCLREKPRIEQDG
jgi:hypothetical protein